MNLPLMSYGFKVLISTFRCRFIKYPYICNRGVPKTISFSGGRPAPPKTALTRGLRAVARFVWLT